MTALAHTSRIVALVVETGQATVEYTPSVDGLPVLTRDVAIPLPLNGLNMDWAIARSAPVQEWFAIRPDLIPKAEPMPWTVTPSSAPPKDPSHPLPPVTLVLPQELV